MLAAQDAPYVLLMDGNIEADSSPIIRGLVQSGQVINMYQDRHPEAPYQPTYLFGGITGEIQAGTKGSSAIVHVLGNHAANQIGE